MWFVIMQHAYSLSKGLELLIFPDTHYLLFTLFRFV